jgi:uncharacterized protein YecE (DUF72 family)
MDAQPIPLSARWHIGTMGFSYDDWSGPFYPERLKSSEWLAYYGRHFDTVELDTTFYAAPTPERVRRWASLVPDRFTFCPKTPRAITHDNPLLAGIGPMAAFVDICRGFAHKLGVILIQFAPTFDASQLEIVDHFLEKLPKDVRYAVEFRHRSWGHPDTLGMLQRHGCGFVSAEYRTRPSRVFTTSDFLYLRWIGVHDTYPVHTQELIDRADDLAWWKQAIDAVLPKVRNIWGFFNNDYAGYSVATANRFKRLIGQEVKEPERTPETPTLFG